MILGVTGNIASGKSSVCGELARRGAVVVDADQLARAVVEPGSPVLEQLVAAFGGDILNVDGSLNREQLGKLIFADPQARERLNAIIHPAIAELAVTRLQELRDSRVPLVVYEAPLLYEAGAEGRVDQVLVVTIAPAVQLERLMARDGFDRDDAQRRIDAQMPQEEKVARADFLIDNSAGWEETVAQIDHLWSRLLGETSPAD